MIPQRMTWVLTAAVLAIIGRVQRTGSAVELDPHTPIEISIIAPADNTVVPTGETVVLKFTGSDVDRCRKNPEDPWQTFNDSLTYTWSGPGEFNPEVVTPEPGSGPYQSKWIAPYTEGDVTLNLAADDVKSNNKPNKDAPAAAQKNVKVGRLKDLSGTYPNKPEGAITKEPGDPNPSLYIPQSATATLTATPTEQGWAQGYPKWSYSLTSGWNRNSTDGNATATLQPNNTAKTGWISATYGKKPNGRFYDVVFNVFCVKVAKVTAAADTSSADSDNPSVKLKLGRTRQAALTATFSPADAPAYSKSTFKWAITDKPANSNPTLGNNPDAFASAADGDYTVTGFLDVNNDNSANAAESSKAVIIAVAQVIVRFADTKIDVFDKEAFTKTFTVEVDDPANASQNVNVTVTRADGTAQFTKLTNGDESSQTKQITLGSDGKGSTTFTITEKDGPGPGIDSLTATKGAVSDTRDARACGITETSIEYQRGGVNNTGIDFNVKVVTKGVGLEHYEKRQYWAANPQSVFSEGKFDYPAGTVIMAPWNITRQNQTDWGSWHAAAEDATDMQTSKVSRVLAGKWRMAYLSVDRYFTIKYQNTSNGNSQVSAFEHNWDFAWNNHNLKVGDWWTEPGGNGTVTRKSNIVNFPW